MKTIIQLGRFGDIFSLIPLVKESVNWIVARDFEDALYGQDFINSIPLDIDVTDIPEALAYTKAMRFENVVVTQVDRNPNPYARRDSVNFQHEMWMRYIGKKNTDTLPNGLPLILPKPVARFQIGIPKVCLCHFKGVSAPFNESWATVLMDQLQEAGIRIYDTANVRTVRITDICAMLQEAKDSGGVLLTIDTAILHLSKAVGIPTFALVNNDKWLAPLTCDHWFGRLPYVRAYSNDGIFDIVQSIKTQLNFDWQKERAIRRYDADKRIRKEHWSDKQESSGSR